MSSSQRFKHESIEDTESIVKYFQAVGEGFAKSALLFSSDEERLVLKPKGLINMDVEAKRKGGEVKLSIKLRWSEETRQAENSGGPLNIAALNE